MTTKTDLRTKLHKATCPKCKTKGRLLRGPWYRINQIRCCECGHRFKVQLEAT